MTRLELTNQMKQLAGHVLLPVYFYHLKVYMRHLYNLLLFLDNIFSNSRYLAQDWEGQCEGHYKSIPAYDFLLVLFLFPVH